MIGKYSQQVVKTLFAGSLLYSSILSAQNLELVFDGGPEWFFNSHRNHINVTDIETDSLSNGQSEVTGDVGLAAYFRQPSFHFSDTSYFNWLNNWKLGVTVRYSGFSDSVLRGKVYQFEQSNLNNYTYHLHLENTRVLARLGFDAALYKQISLYVTGGIGGGWTKVHYQDKPNYQVQGGGLSLFEKTTTSFIGEFAVGTKYQYNNQFALSAGYLYTNYGRIRIGSAGFLESSPTFVNAPSFNLDSHAFLVGIHYSV